jgi:hypothetical protein
MSLPSHAPTTRRTNAKQRISSAVDPSRRRGRIIVVAAIICVLLLLLLPLLYGVRLAYVSCDTRDSMASLLTKTTSILQDNAIEYWLDKGTLLGISRDGGLIPWEYDVDLGVMGEETCIAIYELRSAFSEVGLVVCDASDYVPPKLGLAYDGAIRRFRWSDPHPLEACVRIYDMNDDSAWVDIYGYERYGPDRVASGELLEKKNACTVPSGYDYVDDLVCCSESGGGGCCGRCVPRSTVFPLRRVAVPVTWAVGYREEYLPADPRSYLSIQYGPESLVERRISGWKGYVCGYRVHPWLFAFRCFILMIGISVIIGYRFRRRCIGLVGGMMHLRRRIQN